MSNVLKNIVVHCTMLYIVVFNENTADILMIKKTFLLVRNYTKTIR